MAERIKCKECTNLERRKTLRETNRGSGVFEACGSHYFCTRKNEIMTGQEVLKKGCTLGKRSEGDSTQ